MDEQPDGMAPLLEPAVLVVDNCQRCRGTGFTVTRDPNAILGPGHTPDEPPWASRDPLASDVPKNTGPCADCDGAGRVAREVPVSEFMQLAGSVMTRYQAPSPSEARRAGR